MNGRSTADRATGYDFGRNEELVGEALQPFRQRIFLASKYGMTGIDGKRVIDGRPETLKQTCKEVLQRLRTDVIDFDYFHRWNKRVPVEESVGALADLVRSGYIRAIGLSDVSAQTLRKAHAVYPIAAVQNEYSFGRVVPRSTFYKLTRSWESRLSHFRRWHAAFSLAA